jgi:heme exporter protein A
MRELAADGISFSYGGHRVFGPLTFSVKRGEILAVTGPNGSGKTTLLSVCAGLLLPSSGRVSCGDEHAGGSSDTGGHSFMVTPELRWYRQLSLRENLEFFFGRRKPPEKAELMAERFGLSGFMDTAAAGASSGTLQRLTLAAAFALSPELLVLDEPSTHLDETGKAVLYEVLAETVPSSVCVIATHDSREALLAARRIELV